MPVVEADLRAALRVQAFEIGGRRAARDRRAGYERGRDAAALSPDRDGGAARSRALPRHRAARARRRRGRRRHHDRRDRSRRCSGRAACSSSRRTACSPASTWRSRRFGSSSPSRQDRLRTKRDGDVLPSRATRVAEVVGSARALLVGERTALNFLQRLSGIATRARRFVDAAGGRDHDSRHAEDDADAAGAREVRGARRRRDESSRRALRRDPDQGQPHPAGRRRHRRPSSAPARTGPACRSRSKRRRSPRSTRRSRPAPRRFSLDNMSTDDIREAVVAREGAREDRDLRRRDARADAGAGRDRRRLRVGRRAHALRAGGRHQLRNRTALSLPRERLPDVLGVDRRARLATRSATGPRTFRPSASTNDGPRRSPPRAPSSSPTRRRRAAAGAGARGSRRRAADSTCRSSWRPAGRASIRRARRRC